MTAIQLYTGTYQRFRPDMGVPLRSTVGAPRFPLGYDLAGHWTAVTPDPKALRANLREPDFRALYRAKLDRFGLERVMAEAEGFARVFGDGRLVALCFDDLRKPGNWCHRTMLGEWLTERGVPVIELFPGDGAGGRATPVAPPEPTLF